MTPKSLCQSLEESLNQPFTYEIVIRIIRTLHLSRATKNPFQTRACVIPPENPVHRAEIGKKISP